MPFDLLALQELRICDIDHWKKEATRAGLHLIVPDLAPGSEHLVGFLLRTGTLRPIAIPMALPANRAQVVAWHFDEGPPVLVCNIYGFVTPHRAADPSFGWHNGRVP